MALWNNPAGALKDVRRSSRPEASLGRNLEKEMDSVYKKLAGKSLRRERVCAVFFDMVKNKKNPNLGPELFLRLLFTGMRPQPVSGRN
jgi:hypothetical protein